MPTAHRALDHSRRARDSLCGHLHDDRQGTTSCTSPEWIAGTYPVSLEGKLQIPQVWQVGFLDQGNCILTPKEVEEIKFFRLWQGLQLNKTSTRKIFAPQVGRRTWFLGPARKTQLPCFLDTRTGLDAETGYNYRKSLHRRTEQVGGR